MKLITKEIEEKFKKFPLYSQDGKGGNSEVIVKFFNPFGAGTLYITEGNKLEDGDYEMFGYCHLGDDENAEFGYICLSDLEGINFERDMHFPNNISLNIALNIDGIKVPDYFIKEEENKSYEIKIATGESLMKFDSFYEAKKQVMKYVIDDLLSKDEENNTKYKINFYSIYDTETNNEIIKDNRILNLNYLTDTIKEINENNFRNFKEFLNAEKEDDIQDTIYACCKDSADIYEEDIFNWAKDNTSAINEYIDEMGGVNGKGFDICNLIQQVQIRENEQHYFDNIEGLSLVYALNYIKENNIDINEYDLDESLNMIANNANNFSKFEEITNLIDGKYKNLENEGEEL